MTRLRTLSQLRQDCGLTRMALR